MPHSRLAALTFVVILTFAACSGTSTPANSVPPSVAPSAVAPSAAASGAPSAPLSIAPSAAPSAGSGSAVSIADFSFQPATITISVGTTVTWTNKDNAGHTVTADDSSFTSDRLGSGVTFSHTFATAGTFTYHCAIHASMKGTVTVH
jgi:plastocyanin